IEISPGSIARVDGSSRFAFGNVRALASVSGPIEVRLAAEQAAQATFDVHVRPLSNISATDSKALASAIYSAIVPSLILTQNPRTLVQLVVQVLSPIQQSDASHVAKYTDVLCAAMINASSLALLNAASVPMCGVVCAVPISEGRRQGCFAFLFARGMGAAEGKCVWINWR
ncbi:hypothetical protein FISHEDRAFT_10768, partial [Fistulina hepatica ATCC 64428]